MRKAHVKLKKIKLYVRSGGMSGNVPMTRREQVQEKKIKKINAMRVRSVCRRYASDVRSNGVDRKLDRAWSISNLS